MEADFTRIDLIQVGSLCRKTVKVLPLGKKKQQKIVVGDETGIVTSFSVRKGDIVNRFKTLPLSLGVGKEIMRIELGGSSRAKRDKVFAAVGQSIVGLSKKGKEFFRFETTLTEPVRGLFVEGLNIATTGEYTYNQFFDCKDKHFFMANDRINDMLCAPLSSDAELDAVLACQDRMIRAVAGSDLLYEISVQGPVFTVERHYPELKPGYIASKEFLYGTVNGVFGVVSANNTTIEQSWLSDYRNIDLNISGMGGSLTNRYSKAGVHAITEADVTRNGGKDIIIGRDDGSVEIFSFQENNIVPKLRWKTNLNESIQALDCGQITTTQYNEIVVGTFSGKVLSLTPSISVSQGYTITSPVDDLAQKAASSVEELTRKIKGVQGELEKLSEKVKKEKEKYLKVSQQGISVIQQFKVQTKWQLLPLQSVYLLGIETKLPLDCIVLQSDVPIDIDQYDKSVCLCSKSKPKLGSVVEENNQFLATIRLLEPSNRLEITLRIMEGLPGFLQVYVIPTATPKTSQVVSLPIKSLCLHERILNFDQITSTNTENNNINNTSTTDANTNTNTNPSNLEIMKRTFNEFKLTGSFSVSEIHSWVGICLAEVPERISSEEVFFAFRSSFVGTLLLCTYKKGEAVFKSDSIATLSTLKDVITKEATSRKAKFNVSLNIEDDTIYSVLDLLHPQLEHQFNLATKAKLIEAIREVKLHEPNGISFLAPEYKDVLDNSENIIQEADKQPKIMEYLFGVIVDLYAAKHKFKGKKVVGKEAELKKQLASYSLPALKSFFSQAAL